VINIRNKGANGEREIADALNVQVYLAYQEMGILMPSTTVVQRNQNQSAVGGQDLVGTYGFAIEVKRQEQLSINTWWKQCVTSARNLNEVPVLLFRQNKSPWRCILESNVSIGTGSSIVVRSEISYDDFKAVFREKVKRSLTVLPAAREVHDTGLFPTS